MRATIASANPWKMRRLQRGAGASKCQGDLMGGGNGKTPAALAAGAFPPRQREGPLLLLGLGGLLGGLGGVGLGLSRGWSRARRRCRRLRVDLLGVLAVARLGGRLGVGGLGCRGRLLGSGR